MSSSEEILSGTDDDDILEAIQPGLGKRKTSKFFEPIKKTPQPTADDEINIPTIFLTQGAKNASLLKKANEISQHIREEKEKSARQHEELELIKSTVLAELNENGQSLSYTYKSAHAEIDSYVKRHYANHYSLRAHRHFFFFSDRCQPKLGGVPPENSGTIEALAFCLDETMFPAYVRSLKDQGISSMDVAVFYVENCVDEVVLEGIWRFLQLYNVKSGSPKSIEHISGHKLSFEMPLKMQHYNNNVRLSLLRAALLFEACDSATYKDVFLLNYVLAASDFHANKKKRNMLLELIVKPNFSRVVLLNLEHQLYQVLMKLQPHFYNKPPDNNKQKFYELVFNFLDNLHTVFKHLQSEEKDGLVMLIRSFLHDELTLDRQSSPFTAEEVSQVLEHSFPDPSSPDHAALANEIYKYVYKTKTCTRLLTEILYSEADKMPFLSLHIKLQTLKDRLQQGMSHWLFLSNDIPYKTDVSAALSEAYHNLDHFSSVLNKNLLLIQRDTFYEDG